jgi:spermidine/putrescine transport system permease protein
MDQERAGWAAIRCFMILVYIFMFAPIMIVVVLAFNSAQFGGFPIEGFSFRWFEELYNNTAIVLAFRTSLLLGVLTAVIATTMGVLASLAIVRYEFPG